MAKKNNNKKRKFEHDSSSELYNHRARNRPTEEARIDPTYGQRSAIPGLDGGDNGYYDEDGADLNYDDDMDALSYLRSVRQEATTIPNLLVAPKQDTTAEGEYDRSIYEDGVGDYRGWYEDGAFIAGPEAPVDASSNIDNGEAGKDPQLAYFDSVVTRFKTLRHQLSQTPPNEIIANLGTDHPIYLPTNSKKEVFAKWGYTMKNSDPVPAQLACMDKGTVFRLLTMLTRGTMLKRGCQVGSCLSRWIWGLLARVPDFGELNNVEISAVRELGKKAVLVGVGFKEAQEWGDGMDEVEAGFEGAEEDDLEPELVIDENIQLEDDEEDDIPADILLETAVESSPAQVLEDAIFDNGEFQNDIKDGDTEDSRIIGPEEDFEAAKARMLAQLNEQTQEEEVVTTELEAQLEKANGALPTLNTRATLDMIITVAGELYGQRDLLEFREIWGEE